MIGECSLTIYPLPIGDRMCEATSSVSCHLLLIILATLLTDPACFRESCGVVLCVVHAITFKNCCPPILAIRTALLCCQLVLITIHPVELLVGIGVLNDDEAEDA